MNAQINNKIELEGIETLNRFYGTYIGIVHDNVDTENRGQLLLEVPEVWGKDNVLNTWAQSCFFISNVGSNYSVPEIGDLVYVAFLNGGDARYPIWLGSVAQPKNVKSQMDEKTHLVQKYNSMLVLRKDAISINGDSVVLGDLNNGTNSAVLGDELVSFLDELLGELIKLKTVTGTPMFATSILKFTTMKLNLNIKKNILSKKVKIS